MTYAISAAGLALVQESEGFRAEPTQLPDGNWVVGYSHVRVGAPGEPVTQNEAAGLLALDVAPVERVVNALVSQPLTQSQFDALVSFAFSVGLDAFAESQVLRRVNSADYVAAACAMDAWRKSEVNGELETVDALVRRRAAEKALFMKDMACTPAPSVMVRAKLDHAASILGAPVKASPLRTQAPVVRLVTTSAVSVEADPVAAPPVFEPAVRLTDILKSEPATEALLLTQVVANDVAADDEDGEIVTAHAKPVARPLDNVREATRRAFEAQEAKRRNKRTFPWQKASERPNKIEVAAPGLQIDRRLRTMRQTATQSVSTPVVSQSLEYVGLAALLIFGLGLITLGGSLLFNGAGDAIEIVAAVAVVTPGLAATMMAAYGFWRAPRESDALAA